MNKTPAFVLIFIWSCCTQGRAQISTVSGLVTSDASRQSGAVVKNITRHLQVLSNDIGEFMIAAGSGDTLVTSKEGYQKDTLAITRVAYIIIRLRESPLMLKEIRVTATPVKPEDTYIENRRQYHEIYRKGDKSNILGPDNIDKIWSALSKEGKDARYLQRTLTADYQNKIIDRRFTRPLVSQVTGYKGRKLFYFMSQYRPSYEMIKSSSDYQLIQYIREKFRLDSGQRGADIPTKRRR